MEPVHFSGSLPQGSTLQTLFFLIYINDLSDNILSTIKLFADGTSIFSVVNDANVSADELNKDLQKISEWVYRWKMSFNPDLNKQAQEVNFSRKQNKSTPPKISLRACSLVVSDLRSETKGSRFESGCYLCAEVSSLQ